MGVRSTFHCLESEVQASDGSSLRRCTLLGEIAAKVLNRHVNYNLMFILFSVKH